MIWGILHMFYIGALDTIYIYLREIYFNGTGRYHFFILLFFHLFFFWKILYKIIYMYGRYGFEGQDKSRGVLFSFYFNLLALSIAYASDRILLWEFFFHVNRGINEEREDVRSLLWLVHFLWCISEAGKAVALEGKCHGIIALLTVCGRSESKVIVSQSRIGI